MVCWFIMAEVEAARWLINAATRPLAASKPYAATAPIITFPYNFQFNIAFVSKEIAPFNTPLFDVSNSE